MSKIALSGNASGTGVLSIVAPNTNSDRILNLPDNSGTLLSNASTFAGTGPAFFAIKGSGGNQNISANTFTKITYPNEEFDTNSNYNTSNSRFTPTVAGYYWVRVAAAFNLTAGTQLFIYVNGVMKSAQNAGSGSGDWLEVNSLIYLNGSTDYVEGYIWNPNAFLVYENGTLGQFSAVLVRAA